MPKDRLIKIESPIIRFQIGPRESWRRYIPGLIHFKSSLDAHVRHFCRFISFFAFSLSYFIAIELIFITFVSSKPWMLISISSKERVRSIICKIALGRLQFVFFILFYLECNFYKNYIKKYMLKKLWKKRVYWRITDKKLLTTMVLVRFHLLRCITVCICILNS